MRIVMVTPEFPPDCGGIGYYVYYLSKEIIKAGHEVSVILRGKADADFNWGGIWGTEVRVPGLSPLNFRSFSKSVERVLQVQRPDIVHIHYGAALAVNCGCPVIVTAHWCNKEGIPVFHRPARGAESFARNLLLPLYSYYEKGLSRSCDRFTAVSGSLMGEFREHYGAEGCVVYNGVDSKTFCPNGVNRENLVLFSGMLRRGKGILDLLDVASLLKASHPGAGVVIAGDGPLKDRVRETIRNRGLSNVELTGRLSHAEMVSYYCRARVFVLPTRYEGFPNTVLEAMACELPVVASRVSGIPEQVEEGVTGYMLPPGDVEGFHRRISELLDDAPKCESFGRMGRARVLERFTWEHVSKRVLGEYRSMLAKRSRGKDAAR